MPTLATPGYRSFHNFTWLTFGEQALRLGFVLDPLAAVMLVMITFVSLCIFVFSVGYMAADENFARFFAYLSFFSAAMLGVVIANSLLLLFVCWELVGLASYLLIGFWIHKPSAAAAAKKAFITTRIGDIGFFLGLLWLYHSSGTLLFYDGGNGSLESAGLLSLGASATFIALLIFCGAVGKSGQFPLHVWLPDAMEGPTPVSALIHAATMVAAGVFLVARVYPLFSLGAVNGVTTSLTVVVWIGVVTALISALIALAQADIKRILAYSTVSQLGLMMVSLGVGGVAAGIMHLLAHGFFKALLFLGSGSVIHGCHEEQDIRQMGGLRGLMPVTFLTYAIGMMALSGVPLFFSGAWTKEEILHATSLWSVSRVPHYLMMAGVVLTALYMTRQMIYVFFGDRRDASAHAHESPPVMTGPLLVLAFCTIAFSVVLTPAWPWLHDYLSGETATVDWAHLDSADSLRLARSGRGRNWPWCLALSPGRRDRSNGATVSSTFSFPRKSDVARRTLRLDNSCPGPIRGASLRRARPLFLGRPGATVWRAGPAFRQPNERLRRAWHQRRGERRDRRGARPGPNHVRLAIGTNPIAISAPSLSGC